MTSPRPERSLPPGVSATVPAGKAGVVRVRGAADAEEIAAVVAALAATPQRPVDDAYARWRRARTAALARHPV